MIIEDDRDVGETIHTAITAAIPDASVILIENFSQALAKIRSFDPDIIVLDLYRGTPAAGQSEGGEVWRVVWEDALRPVVVHTAGDVAADLPGQDHPFITILTKGPKSEQKVVEAIRNFAPHTITIQGIYSAARKALSRALQETVPAVWSEVTPDVLSRLIRRRTAALIDELPAAEASYWERYVIPPVGKTILTGDLLRAKEASSEDSTAYRLVISPSCDLENSPDLPVLVARCHPVDSLLTAAGFQSSTSDKKLQEHLPKLLNDDHCGGFVFLPAFGKSIPPMAANLRDLQLIPSSDIGPDLEYSRRATLDSPFRERLIFAFMHLAGRPAVPAQDLQEAIASIIKARKQ